MSAPPLSEAGPTSVGASFYNPTHATYTPHETTPETAQDMAPPLNSDTTPGLGGSPLLDSNFEIAADLEPPEPSYIGEDGRWTLVRALNTLFRDLAAKSSGSGAIIPQETLTLLPSILQTLTQFFGELQANNSQLQATQGSGQGKEQQMEAHIGVLQGEIESVKVKVDELRRDMREVEAQKDSLKAELEQLRVGAILDSGVEGSSKKRPRQG